AKGVDYEFGTLLRDSDRVIVLGERHEARLAALYPPLAEKRVLIPPPPIVRMCDRSNEEPRQAGRKLLGVKPREFGLVYFGYIYPNKGLETLLRAFSLVRSRGHDARLVIAGGVLAHLYEEHSSYVKELGKLAGTLGVANEVVWTGQCDWDTD